MNIIKICIIKDLQSNCSGAARRSHGYCFSFSTSTIGEQTQYGSDSTAPVHRSADACRLNGPQDAGHARCTVCATSTFNILINIIDCTVHSANPC